MRTIRCTVYAHLPGPSYGELGVVESADKVTVGSCGLSYDDENGGRHLLTLVDGLIYEVGKARHVYVPATSVVILVKSTGCLDVDESSEEVSVIHDKYPRDDETGSVADIRNMEPIESDLHCGTNVNTYIIEVPSVAVDAVGNEEHCECVGCTTDYAAGRVVNNNRCTFEYPIVDR